MESIGGDDQAVFCPACGYDLRASGEVGRCPECGREFVKSDLAGTHVPWARRGARETSIAWFETLWMAWRRPAALGREALRPQRWEDARAYARALALLMTLGMLAWYGMFMFSDYGGYLRETRMGGMLFTTYRTAVMDAIKPLLAILDSPWVLVTVAVGGFLGVMGMCWWMRLCYWLAAPPTVRGAASCIGVYSASLWLVMLALWPLGVSALILSRILPTWVHPVSVAVPVALVLLVASVWWLGAMVRTFMEATGRGVMASLCGVALAVVGSVMVLGLSLVLVQFAAGLLALMGRSLIGA